MADKTKDWSLYENGVNYNNRLEPNYYETVNANLDFFAGNQWRNLPDSDMPKPVFNIIKRVITFFVASLTTTKATINYSVPMFSKDNPDPNRQAEAIGAVIAKKQTDLLFEKFKMEFRIKDALFDAAITGDAAAHFYFDMSKKPYGSLRPDIKGEICMELVDGTNVFFGNANNVRVEHQPYIIVSGRDMVKNLQEEAKQYKQDPDEIKEDASYQWQSGRDGLIEVEGDESGKAEYIIVYRKVKKTRKVRDQNGIESDEEYTTVTASKSTEKAYIYQDIDTGMSGYPVSWMNWERTKNSYHGRAIATGILPNQIFINRMFAMVMYHLMMTAFPKAVYNQDAIQLWDNAIGSAIPVTGVDLNTNLKNIAGYLEPGNMSSQIMSTIEQAMQYTKEMLGASDAALGQIDPKNTSAIIAVQKATAVPLENPKSNLYEWIEDIGQIIFDMMGTYYGQRPVLLDDGNVTDFDFSSLKHTWLDVKAEVGESSYWSEIAAGQTLDNLLANGHLDILQYLERVPDNMITKKDELIKEIQDRMAQQQQMQEQQMQQQQQQMADQQAQQAGMAQQQAGQKMQEQVMKHEADIQKELIKAHAKSSA
ncbi:hypothetical protein [Paenibacillus sp. LjRoot56]|uniref:portal protein n=1 Tax=Paenibacillus sp. LjRoot56 TaxID=3342333 RepID=UPI003ECF9692